MPWGLKFDISCGAAGGVPAAGYIREQLELWPPLKPLVTILKLFLLQRSMNEVYTGGLGSFALILSLVAFLKMHTSRLPWRGRQPSSIFSANNIWFIYMCKKRLSCYLLFFPVGSACVVVCMGTVRAPEQQILLARACDFMCNQAKQQMHVCMLQRVDRVHSSWTAILGCCSLTTSASSGASWQSPRSGWLAGATRMQLGAMSRRKCSRQASRTAVTGETGSLFVTP